MFSGFNGRLTYMQKYVIANWKSNKTLESAESWLNQFSQAVIKPWDSQLQVVVAPPFPLLQTVAEKKERNPITQQLVLGVQDISPFTAGSYTGAVAGENLSGFTSKVSVAIVGHSERRRYFKETHQDVANKVARCLELGITPVVCVDDEYIAAQASAIDAEHLDKCVVAYEELGAIGTGNNEPVERVAELVQRIKVAFGQIPVLYGGSVKPGNAADYAAICSGVLVGGASLTADSFANIVAAFS